MSEDIKYTLPRAECLKSRNAIQQLFKSKKTVFHYPYKLFYLVEEGYEGYPQVLFSASKRQFKRAVDRNKIKRLAREAYRLHKPHILAEQQGVSCIGFIYVGKAIEPFEKCHKSMEKVLEKLVENIVN